MGRDEKIKHAKQIIIQGSDKRKVFRIFQNDKKRIPYIEARLLMHELYGNINLESMNKWYSIISQEQRDLSIDDWAVGLDIVESSCLKDYVQSETPLLPRKLLIALRGLEQ
ncbi:ATP-dependent RNA helicase [Acrasis kona]|uniref:ATP-dependent RNA helicase n=1 Tax=Acrasis kona TaxID=1008807 RepID=A0AAW2Z2Z4_9EUKA